MRRTILLVAALVAVGAIAAFAQSGATGGGRTVTVQATVNVTPRGAQVTIGKEIKTAPAVYQLAPGTYDIVIEMSGYRPLNAKLTIDASKGAQQAFNFTLQAMSFRLTVRTNVREATVTLNRVLQKGAIPWTAELAPGTYALLVAAPGYKDYTENVRLDRDVVVDVVLQPATFRLSVQTPVKGAMVMVNRVGKGAAPYMEALPMGAYDVVVTAEGFEDFVQRVNLDRDVSITADMKAAFATLLVTDRYLDGNVQQVKLWIDGKLVNERQQLRGGLQIPAGRHTVRISTAPAGLAVEGEFNFVAGQRYDMQLILNFVPMR